MRTAWLYPVAALVSVFGTIAPASAQTVYTDRAAFLAATSAAQTVTTFNDNANTPTTFYGLTYTGPNYTINAMNSNLMGYDPNAGAGSAYQWNSGDVLSFGLSNPGTFNPAAGVSAFGFDFGVSAGTGTTITINGVTYTANGQPNFNFFGIVQQGGNIAPITINFNGGRGIIDNVRTAEALAPEPATWAMMLVGFGIIGWMLRRRRPQTALRLA